MDKHLVYCIYSGIMGGECTRTMLDQCESVAPSAKMISGNWTATNIDRFCWCVHCKAGRATCWALPRDSR